MIRRSRLTGALSLVSLGPRRTRSPGILWPRPTSSNYSPLTTSLYLDGVSNKCAIWPSADADHAPTDFEYNQPFSAFVWAKLPLVGGGNGRQLICKYELFTIPNRGWSLECYTNGTDQNLLAILLASNGTNFYRRSTNNIRDGVWHHFGFTYDGGNNVSGLLVYIDGVAPATATSGASVTATIKGDKNLMIGKAYQAVTSTFLGYLCHSAVWNVALTPTQVLQIYGGGKPQKLDVVGPTANLVHWCTAGNGCAVGVDNLPDLSPSNIDGQTSVAVVPGDFVADVP